jgi:CheY-like chemotaxis protein
MISLADTNHSQPQSTGPVRVQLVVEHPAHRATLLRALRELVPDARVEQSRSAFDTLLHSARPEPADLLVLDMAQDGAAASALVRHLRRIGQATEVRVFGEVSQRLPSEPCDVWAWSRCHDVLLRWRQDRAAQAAGAEDGAAGTGASGSADRSAS